MSPFSESPQPPVQTALMKGPSKNLVELCGRYLTEYEDKLRFGLEPLPEDKLWWRPHEKTSSIGNLLLHLNGNLSLWILQTLGGDSFTRDRAGEFTANETGSKQELMDSLSRTLDRAREVLLQVDEADLRRPIQVQGYSADFLGVIFHAVEHMSYHTGQIFTLLKQILGPDQSIEIYPQHTDE